MVMQLGVMVPVEVACNLTAFLMQHHEATSAFGSEGRHVELRWVKGPRYKVPAIRLLDQHGGREAAGSPQSVHRLPERGQGQLFPVGEARAQHAPCGALAAEHVSQCARAASMIAPILLAHLQQPHGDWSAHSQVMLLLTGTSVVCLPLVFLLPNSKILANNEKVKGELEHGDYNIMPHTAEELYDMPSNDHNPAELHQSVRT